MIHMTNQQNENVHQNKANPSTKMIVDSIAIVFSRESLSLQANEDQCCTRSVII